MNSCNSGEAYFFDLKNRKIIFAILAIFFAVVGVVAGLSLYDISTGGFCVAIGGSVVFILMAAFVFMRFPKGVVVDRNGFLVAWEFGKEERWVWSDVVKQFRYERMSDGHVCSRVLIVANRITGVSFEFGLDEKEMLGLTELFPDEFQVIE